MLAAGTQIGSYQIERTLGRGGFGIVYIGLDLRLGRRAAIKQLLPEMSGNREVVERFFNEAKAAASINHPGIVEIYDVGWHTDGSAYFAMKLLDGESLHSRLQAGWLAIPLAATIARQVAGALVAAHARGIIHRDLKPDNIMLIRDDEVSIGERAVLLDFGIAKLTGTLGNQHTQTGMMMGTPKYMSPEQCRGAGEVDHRTDLYALGCILFEMLSGRVPFLADGAGEVMGMHQFVEPPLLRAFRADVPAELEQLVNRLLAKRLDQRMQLVGELQTALQPFTSGMPSSPMISAPNPVVPAPSPAEVIAGMQPTVPPTQIQRPRPPTPSPLAHDAPTHAVADPRLSTPDAVTRAVPEAAEIHVDDRSRVLSSPIRIPATLTATQPTVKRSKLPLILLGIVVAGGATTAIVFATRKQTPPTADPATTPDAAVTKPRTVDPRRDELLGQCEQWAADKKWPELANCAGELDAIDPAAAKQYVRSATQHGATVALAPRPAGPTPADAASGDCAGADALATKGETALSRGEFGAAFEALETAYACKPALLETYYVASCRSRNFDRAKELFAKFPAAKRDDMARLCLKDGLDPRKSQ